MNHKRSCSIALQALLAAGICGSMPLGIMAREQTFIPYTTDSQDFAQAEAKTAPPDSYSNASTGNGSWKSDGSGTWYEFADGTYLADTLKVIDGQTYQFDTYGYRCSGWKKKDGAYRYFDPADGAMKTSTWIDGDYVNEQGIYIPNAWQKDGDAWQMRLGDGSIVRNSFWHSSESGNTYSFDENGHMQTGWISKDGKDYYFISGSGEMARNRWIHNSYLGEDGAWIPTRWQKNAEGKWWLRYGDGSHPASETLNVGGTTYYFNEDGTMAEGWTSINNNWYLFDANGQKVTRTTKDGWYLNANGIAFAGHDVESAKFMDSVFDTAGNDFKSAYTWITRNSQYKKLPDPLPIEGDRSEIQNYAHHYLNNSHTGNCYCFASMTWYAAKCSGLDPIFVKGFGNFSNGRTAHGWVEIVDENGVLRRYDSEVDYELRRTGKSYFGYPVTEWPKELGFTYD